MWQRLAARATVALLWGRYLRLLEPLPLMTSPRPFKRQERTNAGVPTATSGAGQALRVAESQREADDQAESGVYPRIARRVATPTPAGPRRHSKWWGLLCACLVLGALLLPRALESVQDYARQELDAQLAESAQLQVEWSGLELRREGVYLQQVSLKNREPKSEPMALRVDASGVRLKVNWWQSLLAQRVLVSTLRIERAAVYWREAAPSPARSTHSLSGPSVLTPQALDQLLDTLWNSSVRSTRVDALSLHVEPSHSPRLGFDVRDLALLRRAPRELELRASVDQARVAQRNFGAGRVRGVLADHTLHLLELAWRSEFGRAEAQGSIDLGDDAKPAEVAGSIHLEPSQLPHLLNEHAPSGVLLKHVTRAALQVRGRGSLFVPSSWNLEGQARLDSVRLEFEAASAEADAALELERVDLRLEHELGDTRCQFSARAPGAELSGNARRSGNDVELSTRLQVSDLRWVWRFAPARPLSRYVTTDPRQPFDLQMALTARREGGRWSARGELGAVHLAVRTPRGLSPIDALRSTWRYQTGQPLRIEHLTLDAPAARLSGEGWLRQQDYSFQLRAEALKLHALDSWVPGVLRSGTGSGTLEVNGNLNASSPRARGDLRLVDVKWLPPASLSPEISAAKLDALHTHVEWRDGALSLSELQGQGSLETSNGPVSGAFDGWLKINAKQLRWGLQVEPIEAHLLGLLIPGIWHDGSLRLALRGSGTRRTPLTHVEGRAELREGRWSAPPGTPWCGKTFELARAASDFSWNGQRLHLTRLRFDSEHLRAQGELLHSSDSTFLDAQLVTHRAGEVLSLLPELKDLLRGGSGVARVRLRVTPRGTAGVVEGQIRGGTLAVASFNPNKPEAHPIETASFEYDFGAAWQRLRSLTLRGPELNVDLDVGWFDSGSLQGEGRVWLTRSYTQHLAKGAGWLLDLLGYRRIASRFQLSGSPRFVRLQADIVRDWQWRALQVAIPKDVAKVARGDKPLLVALEPRGLTPACR